MGDFRFVLASKLVAVLDAAASARWTCVGDYKSPYRLSGNEVSIPCSNASVKVYSFSAPGGGELDYYFFYGAGAASPCGQKKTPAKGRENKGAENIDPANKSPCKCQQQTRQSHWKSTASKRTI